MIVYPGTSRGAKGFRGDIGFVVRSHDYAYCTQGGRDLGGEEVMVGVLDDIKQKFQRSNKLSMVLLWLAVSDLDLTGWKLSCASETSC